MDYAFEKNRITGGIGADDEYWRGLEQGRLQLPRCAGCGQWTWPAHFRCGGCGSWEFRWVELPPRGRVYTWTRSWYAFDRVRERAADVPYVTLVVELPEAAGARVMGVLEGSEAGLHIGADVTGVIAPPEPKTKGYPSIRWRLVAP